MVIHLYSPENMSDRVHLVETLVPGSMPLGPDKKQVRFEEFDILERIHCLEDVRVTSDNTPEADGRERRSFGQPRPKINGDMR